VHSDSSPTWDSENQRYYTDFTIPADGSVGNYTMVWKAAYGSNSWVVSREFAVEAPWLLMAKPYGCVAGGALTRQ
jgi:hypothetical protein